MTQEDYYVFRHPHITIRSESFGGLAQVEGNIYVLASSQFKFLSNFEEYAKLDEVRDVVGEETLQIFLETKLLVKIPRREAENILDALSQREVNTRE